MLDQPPAKSFKQFYKMHFNDDANSFESESIKSDLSLEVTPVFEFEIPLDVVDSDSVTVKSSKNS